MKNIKNKTIDIFKLGTFIRNVLKHCID